MEAGKVEGKRQEKEKGRRKKRNVGRRRGREDRANELLLSPYGKGCKFLISILLHFTSVGSDHFIHTHTAREDRLADTLYYSWVCILCFPLMFFLLQTQNGGLVGVQGLTFFCMEYPNGYISRQK